MPDQTITNATHQDLWHRYYSEKRIVHQWLQVHLLGGLAVRRVLEIGPYLGAVTALLCSAGYDVTTLDIERRRDAAFAALKVAHIEADIRDLDAARIAALGIDAILCCETLEHLPYQTLPDILGRLAATGARYLVLSVPYMGTQLSFSIYVNRHVLRKYTSFKKFFGFRRFPAPAADGGWDAHRWEIGYRDYPLDDFRHQVETHYRVLQTEFTSGCRSVFLLCENKSARPESGQADAGSTRSPP
jgi:hypothetical protein